MDERSSAAPVWTFGLAISLGAFLLFQIEPMIAKMILPWFGGAASVWTACMLFFQAALLFGYMYADILVRRVPGELQSRIHLTLLGISLFLLPVTPSARWRPDGTEQPVLRILVVLAVTIGVQFFLLASTSPLVQALYARTRPGGTPYRFFALSNLASMLALLTYPVLIEPSLSTHHQSWIWSCAYAAYAIITGYVVLKSPAARRQTESAGTAERPALRTEAAWVLLPALASTLLLAGTNYLCQNVAAVPFLWVLPLSAYLLSFILCFDRRQWYDRPAFLIASAFALIGMCLLVRVLPLSFNIPFAAGVVTAGVFVISMFCHGEVAKRKPAPAYLTRFYLMIAAGGAIGGLLVGVAAPLLLPGTLEFAITLTAVGIAILVCEWGRGVAARIAWATATILVTYAGLGFMLSVNAASETVVRNFYGSLRVEDNETQNPKLTQRKLIHAAVEHGRQILEQPYDRRPTTYYAPGSGVQLAIASTRSSGAQRVGVVGLGAGTLAAYGRPGDTYRFYEINPQDVSLAREYFSFLNESAARVDVVLGDGRLSLEREPGEAYDVLAVDAFSGDSIPTHLLSREAIQLYMRHLTGRGILALHISNKALDLEPVVAKLTESLGLPAVLIDCPSDPAQFRLHSFWALLAQGPAPLQVPEIARHARPLHRRPELRTWTDDYSTLWQILR